MSTVLQVRQLLRMSQAALAEQLGCTQGNVSLYERGQTLPPAVAARLIEVSAARGLVISYDHVYGARPLPELLAAEGAPAVPQEVRDAA